MTQDKRDKVKDQFGLFLKDGIIKCARRYRKLQLPKDTNYPVLLSHDGTITRLKVEKAHRKMMHSG